MKKRNNFIRTSRKKGMILFNCVAVPLFVLVLLSCGPFPWNYYLTLTQIIIFTIFDVIFIVSTNIMLWFAITKLLSLELALRKLALDIENAIQKK